MTNIIRSNRELLNKIENWIDKEALEKSKFRYGIPDYIEDKINLPINEEQTYTDVIVDLAKRANDLKYLEVGVSVGKNFYQVVKNSVGSFTGIDIESENPILKKLLKKEKYEYIQGDVLKEDTWAKLKGKKFNLIFSDCLHTPQALEFEVEMLKKYDLLDDKFVIVWDDLQNPDLKQTVQKIANRFDSGHTLDFQSVNGWIGQHEFKHDIAVFSKL